MSVSEIFGKLIGEWTGANRLHAPWIAENPITDSDSKAKIEFSAQGRFLKIEYDWAFQGEKQEGLILLGIEKETNSVKAFWIDSWHMGDKFMVSEGTESENGTISLKGFYKVLDHPDWGWRTVLESENPSSFKITMYNVSPEGEESLAVEANYQRL
jgi:Protein of unknown function (DUF1579).